MGGLINVLDVRLGINNCEHRAGAGQVELLYTPHRIELAGQMRDTSIFTHPTELLKHQVRQSM